MYKEQIRREKKWKKEEEGFRTQPIFQRGIALDEYFETMTTPTKAKSKSATKKVQESSLVASNFDRFSQGVLNWKKARDFTLGAAREIVNLRNQASYLKSAQVMSALGSTVQPSRMTQQTRESLAARIKQLRELQQEMLENLKHATMAWQSQFSSWENCAAATIEQSSRDDAGDWGLDTDFTRSLLDQMNQQTLLEMCAAETLTMSDRSSCGMSSETALSETEDRDWGDLCTWGDDLSIDADTATTLLLCFTHPPYLSCNIESIFPSR